MIARGGRAWPDRVTQSHLAEQAVAGGHASHDELARIADAWRAWAANPDAWFTVVHGEILARA